MPQANLLAVVDVGSNSFRLEVVRPDGQGGFALVLRNKRAVRQGAGLQADGSLSPQALQDGWDCLAEFGQQLQQLQVRHVRAVATQTLRQASNRQQFLQRAAKLLGHPLEVISGQEEGRLTYLGVDARLPASTAQRLVIDVGGRSTEWALGRNAQVRQVCSFAVGSVGWSVNHFADGQFSAQAYAQALAAAQAHFAPVAPQWQAQGWQEIYICAGTANAVCEILAAHNQATDCIHQEHLHWLYQQLLAAGDIAQLKLAGLSEARRPVLAGGLAVLQALFSSLGVVQMQRTLGALRAGVLRDMAQQLSASP
ncbi:MAG: Ppx/GppA family phosphatase [Comamonas sp.]|nr:Ppx/GppA family phosphatase [Comamonas sp.]